MKLPHIFHDWCYDKTIDVVLAKHGPFDVCSDERRTVKREIWVCCKCGRHELRPEPEDYYPL